MERGVSKKKFCKQTCKLPKLSGGEVAIEPSLLYLKYENIGANTAYYIKYFFLSCIYYCYILYLLELYFGGLGMGQSQLFDSINIVAYSSNLIFIVALFSFEISSKSHQITMGTKPACKNLSRPLRRRGDGLCYRTYKG